MNILRDFLIGIAATAVSVSAQTDLQPGRSHVGYTAQGSAPDNQLLVQNASTPSGDSSGYAEVITPDIQTLADSLQDDPLKIFNYVHDHIRFVLYYGSLKGAEMTLLEQSGNDFDQCALLSALLQAAGYSPSYGFGMLEMPYQATDGTENDLKHWLQLSVVNTNWSNTTNYFNQLMGRRGYTVVFYMGDGNTVAFQRIWVNVTVGGTNFVLDPAFKVSEPVISQFNLASAMGLSSNTLMTAAGGIDTANYVTNLNEISLRGALTGCTTNLLNYLQSNCPNASVQQVLGGWQIMPSTNVTLSQALLFPTFTDDGNYPLQNWGSEPTNFMSNLSVSFAGTNVTWYFPQLLGQGMSLTFSSSGTASLWLGNSVVLQSTNTGTGSSTTVTLSATHPYGGWSMSSNTPYDTGDFDQSAPKSFQRTNASYAILYCFEPSVKWLNRQEQQLDEYLASGYSNTAPVVVNATLNVMGMEWMVQTELAHNILCQEANVLPAFVHRIGRMSQESGNGYYVDVYMQQDQSFSATGAGPSDFQTTWQVFDTTSYIWSALEHAMIEQMQPSNFLAASTVKMLQLANTNSQAVYLATSNNWSAISSHLVNYSSLLSTFSSDTSEGYEFLLPQNGAIPIAGSGSWTGTAFVERYAPSDNYHIIGMAIGQEQGGYAADLNASINTSYTQLSVQNQPSFFISTPLSTPAPLTADPVDTADDTYQVLTTDLSVGQAEPKGISLSRYYNGTRRLARAGGMTGGWVNNYCVTANNVAAPQAGLGQTTPAQMASMLVASSAILAVYNGDQPDPKNWMVTALISKWGVDQLIKNGVSVNLGKDTLQFIQQPNGAFTPPANCTSTLTTNGSVYALHLRHGNTFRFNSSGYLTNIVDQYSNSLSLTYTSSNWVQAVKDWKNRTLTFTYSGSPVRLASISDGTRTVHYGYSTVYSSQGDLTSFTNAQGNVTTYQYDTNHDIVATLDAQNRMVVSNVYNAQDQLMTQYVDGNTNKMWRIDWSGWQTTEFDPAGDEQTYFYDDQGRLIASEDALGNLTRTEYDGQNHVIATISPLDETNLFLFDGNNNLTNSTDPLEFSSQYLYDGNNNLVKSVDPRGNASTFGYNSEFSLIGQTNGAGDWVNYAYNGDGTLHTRTDSGGTTTCGYDSFGQLNSVECPGISTSTFANSYAGDVTNHVGGRGFATAYQYNALRQLTNAIAPTNLVTKTAYDPEGNQASVTDARGNITSQSWSATRKQLSTTFPAMSAGTPIVTNLYDNRDWLTGRLDPLQNETTYANDPDEHLISEADPVKRTTTLGYDADGRQLAVTNAASEATYQTWDAKSELIKLTDGAGHTSLRGYDYAGNQIVLTNRNSNPWHFYFDGANRLTNTVSPLGRSTTIVFNHQGLPAQITDPLLQTTTHGYDANGRLTNRADNVASTFYRYDADDNLTNISENGLTNAWTFDAYDRVSSYRDVYGNLIQYRYDANGNLTNLVYPGGRNVYYAYDSNNQMTNVVDWSGRKTTITYDLDGHLAGIYRPNGTCRTVSYDSAGEVTNILEQMANGLPIALMRYNWDLAARMSLDFVAPLPHTNSPPLRSMTYDADNELATVDGSPVAMDSDGNLLSGPLTNDTFATYTYDARNRLLNAGGVTNYYDAANNRVGQACGANSIEYIVNPNAKLPQVLERIKNGVTTYYIYGPGLLYQITEASAGTNTITYHYDICGSTIALTGDNGLVTDRMEYSLYATMTYHTGTNDTPFLFNGCYGVMSDPNGLLYMRARYYNPYLCRFLNADPTGFSGGLNFYVYANGDPASYFDPFGMDAQSAGSTFFSWVGGAASQGLTDWQNAQGFNLPGQLSSAYENGGGGLGGLINAEWSVDPGQQIANAITGVDTLEGPGYGQPLDTLDRTEAILNSVGIFAGTAAGVTSTAAETTAVDTGASSAMQGALLRQQLAAEETVGAQLPQSITGYTSHGIDQVISRNGVGVSPSSILDTWQNPSSIAGRIDQYGGSFRLGGQNATIVVNPQGQIITAWPNGSAGFRITP